MERIVLIQPSSPLSTARLAAAIAVDAGGEQRVERVDALGAELLDDRLGLLGDDVGDDERVDLGNPDQGVRVERPDPAEAYESEPHALQNLSRR